MVEELRKIFLAGIGSAAYTYEKASKLVEELVSKGKLTIEEGKDLSQELKKNFKDKTKETTDKIKPLTKEDLREVLQELNLPTRDEIDNIKKRLDLLENKLETK